VAYFLVQGVREKVSAALGGRPKRAVSAAAD
jgi:hypothetical protein